MVDHKNDQAIQSHRSVSGESERPMDVNAIQDVLPHGVDPSLTDAQAVADALNVDPNMGLSQAEAERRLAKFWADQHKALRLRNSGRTNSPPHLPYRNGRNSWPNSETRSYTCCWPPPPSR